MNNFLSFSLDQFVGLPQPSRSSLPILRQTSPLNWGCPDVSPLRIWVLPGFCEVGPLTLSPMTVFISSSVYENLSGYIILKKRTSSFMLFHSLRSTFTFSFTSVEGMFLKRALFHFLIFTRQLKTLELMYLLPSSNFLC